MKKRVLIVKLSAIGDVVMALPMIEAAKKKYGEDVEITWVCGKIASPIIKTFFEDVKVIEVEEKKLLKGSFFIKIIEVIKLWLKIALRKFDLVATAHSDIRYRLLTLPVIAKIKRHWGVTNGRKHPVPGRYHGIEAVWLITGDDDSKLEEYITPLDKLKIGDECNCRQTTVEDALKPSLEGGDLTSENINSLEQPLSKTDNKNTINQCLTLEKGLPLSRHPSVRHTSDSSPQVEPLEQSHQEPKALNHHTNCNLKDGIATAPTAYGSQPPQSLRDSSPTVCWGASSRSVVLVPGGAKNVLADNPCRRWNLEKYVELAQKLLEKGYEVIIVGSDSDKWVNTAFEGLEVTNLIGKTNLMELLRILSQADVVVTHDTGTFHLAQLVSKKIVALFGPTNPNELAEKSINTIILWKPENLPCCPCYDGKTYAECKQNKCMDKITVKEVLEVICG